MQKLPIDEYIWRNFRGNRTAFAAAFGIHRQNVPRYMKIGAVVIDDVLYKPIAARETPDEASKDAD